MKTENNNQYFMSTDSHVYKVLKDGHVLHVNYSDGLINVISPAVWEDINDKMSHAHTSMQSITKEKFESKAKSVLVILKQAIGQ